MDSAISNSIKSILNFGFKIVSFWFKLWLLPINSIFEFILEKVKPILDPLFSFFQTHKAKLLKYSLLSILYLGFLLFVTLISYYAVYVTLVPKVSTEEQLFFDYNYKSNKKIVADVQASVEFQKNKHYSIFLELELPESPKNQDIGMFMACMEIDDQDKWNPQKIHHTCRPAILKYSSGFLKNIKSFVMSIPFLMGFYEEKQTIVLSMGDNFIANRYYQTISAQIQINNPDLQIYKASLKFLANLNGFDYYLYYYPITSFIIGCSFIYIGILSTTLFMLASLYLYRHFKQQEDGQFESYNNNNNNNNIKKSSSFNNLSIDKDEDEEEIEFIHNSLVGEDNNQNEASSSSFAQPPPPAASVPSSQPSNINAQRRNGANYKRRPIWEIDNDDEFDNDINIKNSLNNQDSLNIFASPKFNKAPGNSSSEIYKELDEAFNSSQSSQKNFNNTINNNNYSWDQELKDIDNLINNEKQQQQQKEKEDKERQRKEYEKNQANTPIFKRKQQKREEQEESKNQLKNEIGNQNIILPTSENTTPVSSKNNNNDNNDNDNQKTEGEDIEKEIAPIISLESSIIEENDNVDNNNQLPNSSSNNDENDINKNEDDNSPINISDSSDKEGDSKEDDKSNSGIGSNDEWVKVSDSSIRRRKN